MKFIDFFSGVGGFTRGLELAGHECIGHCEFDKFAEASYRSIHTITEEQRARLGELDKKKRQKEILNSEYLNGEWYANDVRTVRATNMPIADCWTFGAPCQDFSIAGRRAGLDGERSSLVREIFRILEETEEKNKPTWLIYENVKGMLSSNRGLDFLSILSEMDRLGYDAEWQIVNSRWFVPQNRERVYVVGHYRGRSRCSIFPVKGNGGKNSTRQLIGGVGAKTGLYAFGIDKTSNKPQELQISNCLMTKDYGVSKRRSEDTAIAIPVLTPARAEKKQNGRRCKEAGEEMFTLTAQDQHGIAIKVREATKRGYAIAGVGDSINLSVPSSKTRRGRVGENIANTLDTSCNQGVVTPTNDTKGIWAVWSEKYNCYLAIRKLTPKECFRLQGWADDYFERAEFMNSSNQLYKQAGNGVTVNVVQAIGEKI
ncbi:DNA cytosine methyltransferase [Mogibacterium diversum]|uniref:DNA cytosine methyltransferase n=1 Tax=Mogibacterium diversum TaxID=114527 RepID=UPI0028D257B2|nr:DNA (cytosine-5-)-methyltransferase [Mogibacterium diversum]